MTNYNEYLEFDNGEYKEQQEKIMDKIKFSPENIESIKSINGKTLKIIAQPYCPDCRALVAVLENMIKINDNIDITYVVRQDGTDYRLPTIIINDKMVFVEFPKKVKEIMEVDSDKDSIIYNYRTGKYNKELIEELIDILI
ncbi:thioredoxin family protein [Oceanivirga salmonicida]|uniref:thioredoxin family protein n=1 Tax=Oceanivirga salmonicida TaxID=1769291 RepID=UPI0012E27996|nr:thioredoxin family protein [Oceanivirga salmonicida]